MITGGRFAVPFPVTQDTIAVTDQAPVSTDGYVKLSLDTSLEVNRIITTGMPDTNPGFNVSAQGKLLLTPAYAFGNGSFLLNQQVFVAQPILYIQPLAVTGESNQGLFVYNGGGTGAHKLWTNSAGDQWVIWDIGANAALYPQVKYDSGDGSIINNGQVDCDVYDNNGKNAISCRSNGSIGLQDIWVDTATGTNAERLVQDSGSDITFTSFDPTSNNNNPLQQFWLQIYHNTNVNTPSYERWEHNTGGGQINFPVSVELNFGGGVGGFVTVQPNATAAADGEVLRYNNGFIANLSANSTIGIEPDFAPNSLTSL